MVWNAPATVTTGQVMTSAFWNQQVRDNMLETSAAVVTTAGDIAYADAANSMGAKMGIGSAGGRVVSTGSIPVWRYTDGMIGDTTYTGTTPPTAFSNLNIAAWGTGTAVTVTVTTGTAAIVYFGARYVSHGTLGSNVQLSYQVGGATTIAANSAWGTLSESDPAGTLNNAGRAHRVGLTAGSNVFTLNALASTSGATALIGSPYIVVEAL